MNLNIIRNCWTRCGLAAAGLACGVAFGQDSSERVGLINAFRSESQSCQGERIDAVGPLAPDAALARVKPGAGGNLLEAAREQGYQAARVETIRVSGPADAAATMKLVTERYCRQLLSQQYTQIGVSRTGVAWQILLARPVVSAELGEWGQAGREILRLTNKARAHARICGDRRFSAAPALAWTPDLGAAALAHSRDMATGTIFAIVPRTAARWATAQATKATGGGELAKTSLPGRARLNGPFRPGCPVRPIAQT